MLDTSKSNERLISLLRRVPKERLKSLYERHGVPTSKGVETLVAEIRLDGSNSIASIFRGGDGVDYLEIVRNVADKMNVPYKEDEEEDVIELAILFEMVQKFWANASKEEREEVQRSLGDIGTKLRDEKVLKSLGTISLGIIMNTIGKKATVELVKKIVLWIALRQGAREAGKRAAQIAGLAVPLLNVAMVAWTVIDVAGPAYRKTVPTVIEIGLLRMEFGNTKKE